MSPSTTHPPKPRNNALQLLSVVIPCYNEEEIIRQTHQRLTETLSGFACNYELIFVDDGSSDNTAQLLEELQQACPQTRCIFFSRNFGHQRAVSAGIANTEGDAVVLIDADLQDPPEVIPQMIELWQQGYDVVYGQRDERKGETFFKKATANLFYRCINRLSEIPIPLNTGDFRLMDRCVVDVLQDMPEHDRFLRGMVSWAGFHQTPIHYTRDPRTAGETKYPLRKMIRFALDGITSFSRVPLKLAALLGLFSCGLAFAGIVYSLIIRLFTEQYVQGWTTLMLVVLFLGGAQLLCLGIIGEYVGRTYMEGKQRPLYVIKKKTGFNDPAAND